MSREYQQRAFGAIEQGRCILAEMAGVFMEQVVVKLGIEILIGTC